MKEHSVLVYGTLKSSERNSRYMEDALFLSWEVTRDSHYLMAQFESATSPGKFTPGVRKVEQGGACIEGEVYLMDDATLAKLDELEGVGVKYDREEVALQNGNKAWMYFRRGEGILPSRHIHFDKRGNLYRWAEVTP